MYTIGLVVTECNASPELVKGYFSLNVDGLTKATYVVVGSGSSTSLGVSEMIGDTNSTLATDISSTKFMSGLQNFSYSTESVGRFRGLQIDNLSSNSYTITSIKVIYNQ